MAKFNKATRSRLQMKVDHLSRMLKIEFRLDSQSAGRGKGYRLVEIYKYSNGKHDVHNHLMSASEMNCYLDGFIDGVTNYEMIPR